MITSMLIIIIITTSIVTITITILVLIYQILFSFLKGNYRFGILNQWIGFREKIQETSIYFMGNPWFPVDFPGNQSIESMHLHFFLWFHHRCEAFYVIQEGEVCQGWGEAWWS